MWKLPPPPIVKINPTQINWIILEDLKIFTRKFGCFCHFWGPKYTGKFITFSIFGAHFFASCRGLICSYAVLSAPNSLRAETWRKKTLKNEGKPLKNKKRESGFVVVKTSFILSLTPKIPTAFSLPYQK